MTPLVRFAGVGLTYPGPPPVPALRPTDLLVRAGEHVAVVGPSGSGKSTFLNVVGLLDRPTEGKYEFEEVDVGELDERRRSALRGCRIGFVFQDFHLMPYRSAVENVALARVYTGVPKAERLAAARSALRRVGLAHRAGALTNTLSGGERQRVAIARAVVHRPKLLLCDEPTGNLDSRTASEVLELLEGLQREGMTMIVITHDLTVASRAQRILNMRDGVLS